jgi:hypothetical protein
VSHALAPVPLAALRIPSHDSVYFHREANAEAPIMKRFLLALFLVVAPATTSAQAPRVRSAVPGYPRSLSMDSLASAVEILASKGAIFAAASAVFSDLKIPLGTHDSVGGIVGNGNLIKLHSLAGAPMSRLLNCGSGMTGPNADDWRIYISVFAMIEGKSDEKSVLRVGFIAGAKDVQGAAKDAVACGTTGVFESMFIDRVKKRLAT